MSSASSENDSGRSDNEQGGPGGRRLPPPIRTRGASQDQVLDLLTELEQLPGKATAWFGRRVLIGFDADRFETLVQKIRANLPQDVVEACQITRQRSSIIQKAQLQASMLEREAREEAEKTRRQAQQDADHILQAAQARRDEILQMAEREAQAVRDRAAADAARMVSESEVMRQARETAQTLVTTAESEAKAIRNGANQYAFAVLRDLSEVVDQMSQTIENGKRMLAERTGAPANEER